MKVFGQQTCPAGARQKKMLSLLVVISHFGLSRGFNSSPQELTEKIMQKGTNATNGAWTVNQPLFLLRKWTVEVESWWYFKQNLVSNDWWELPSPSNKKVAQVAQCSHSWNGNAALVSTCFKTAPHKGAKGQFEWCRPNIHWCLRDWFHVENLLLQRSKIVRGKGMRVGKTKTSMVWAWNVDVDSQVPKKK